MTNEQRAGFQSLEGQRVSLALIDGTRLDDCELVSAGRHRTATLWLFADGADTFVPIDDVIDLWAPSRPVSHHRVA
jgi:hypothetical protein